MGFSYSVVSRCEILWSSALRNGFKLGGRPQWVDLRRINGPFVGLSAYLNISGHAANVSLYHEGTFQRSLKNSLLVHETTRILLEKEPFGKGISWKRVECRATKRHYANSHKALPGDTGLVFQSLVLMLTKLITVHLNALNVSNVRTIFLVENLLELFARTSYFVFWQTSSVLFREKDSYYFQTRSVKVNVVEGKETSVDEHGDLARRK